MTSVAELLVFVLTKNQCRVSDTCTLVTVKDCEHTYYVLFMYGKHVHQHPLSPARPFKNV